MQHYPARLHQLYLVDLPVVLKWVVSAVKPVLQPESWGKIQVCQLPSPLFPFPAALLDFSVSQKRVSLPSTAPSKMPQQQVSNNSPPTRITNPPSYSPPLLHPNGFMMLTAGQVFIKKHLVVRTTYADAVGSAALVCMYASSVFVRLPACKH